MNSAPATTFSVSLELPTCPDVEAAFLGAILTKPKLWAEGSDVRPEDFHSPDNALVWHTICSLARKGTPPDELTVRAKICAGHPPGGEVASAWMRYTADLMTSFATLREVRNHAALIRDCAERRRMIEALAEGMQTAAAPEPGVVASAIANNLMAELNTSVRLGDDIESAFDIAARVIDDLSRPLNVRSTGLPRLDSAMGGGILRGAFTGLAGGQKAGKSTLMGTIAWNLTVGSVRAREHRWEGWDWEPEPLVYLSLEMKPEQQLQRIMARSMARNSLDFIDPQLRSTGWFGNLAVQARNEMEHCGLYYLARPRMNLKDLRATLARIALSGKFKGVMLDYVQLVTGGKAGSQTEHLDDVNQTIAEWTVNSGMWCIAGAQLNSQGQVRGGAGLNAACDIAFAIHKNEDVAGPNGTFLDNEAWLECLAARHVRMRNVGTEEFPAYRIRTDVGPYFDELEPPHRVD